LADIAVSVMYWIVNFAMLSLQLVIAFLLLSATMDVCLYLSSLSFSPNKFPRQLLHINVFFACHFSFFKQMTTDPETMMKKCIWWRGLSILFFLMLSIDLSIIIYEHLQNGLPLKLFRTLLNCFEILFRGYAVYFVGKFIRDLRSLFEAPMVQYDSMGTPIPPSPNPSPRSHKNRFKDRIRV
jgi:hypothetical protein